MNKQLKHTDLDSQLLDLPEPIALFWNLAGLATLLIIISTWLALAAAMVAGWLDFQLALFCTIPIGVWLGLLAAPALYHARRGAVAILNALATTAEAWLYRAGYSIDLNRDGNIGYTPTNITVEPPEVARPILIRPSEAYQLMPNEAPNSLGVQPAPEQQPQRRPRLWQLPDGQRIPTETIIKFVEGVFIRGLNRDTWVGRGKALDRKQYDALIKLLEQVGVLVDRKPGTPGRLAVEGSTEAKKRLNLPLD